MAKPKLPAEGKVFAPASEHHMRQAADYVDKHPTTAYSAAYLDLAKRGKALPKLKEE